MFDNIKDAIKGYKTVALNSLSIVIAVLEISRITDYLSDEQMLTYAIGMALGNIALRIFATTTKFGNSE